jgi:hypothetical protein
VLDKVSTTPQGRSLSTRLITDQAAVLEGLASNRGEPFPAKWNVSMSPTSGTTALLALGDAHATVVSVRGFPLVEYGFRHRADALGRQSAEPTAA